MRRPAQCAAVWNVARRWPALAILLLLFSPAVSVAAPPPESVAEGVRDAAREAKGEKKRVLEAESKDDDESEDSGIDWMEYLDWEPDPEERLDRPRDLWHGGLTGGARYQSGSPLRSAGGLGVTIGYRQEGADWTMDLALLGSTGRFTPGSGLAESLLEPVEVEADLSLRYTPADEPIPFQPMVGLAVGSVFWDYAGPVLVDSGEGPEPVLDDDVVFWAPYAGVSATLVRGRRAIVSALLEAGMRFYRGTSGSGLRNDVFPNAPFLRVGVETSFPF